MQDPERRLRPRSTRRRENSDLPKGDYLEDDYGDADYAADLLPTPTLPRNRVARALVIGIVAGLITALIYFLVPFLDAHSFQQAAILGAKMKYSLAVIVAKYDTLRLFAALIVCAFAGYFVGKYAVQRRLGFLAGLLIGIIYYVGTVVASYIPIYPGSSLTPPFLVKYLLPLVIIALIFGIIGGLISLIVTWLTTRKHPYYTSRWD